MSMGGSASAPRPPRLKTIDVGSAADLVKQYNTAAFDSSDAAYANPGNAPGVPQTGPLVTARNFAIGDLLTQSSGALSSQTGGALATAGLGTEGSKIAGPTELATSRNLGQPLLAKEMRDRNFAQSFLAQNPERSIGLTGNQALDILVANTGNINAYNQSIYSTQQAAANQGVLQEGQNALGAANLFGGLTSILSNYLNKPTPYTDPFNSIWGPGFNYQANPDTSTFIPGYSDAPLGG
jgi:hypothetical protein